MKRRWKKVLKTMDRKGLAKITFAILILIVILISAYYAFALIECIYCEGVCSGVKEYIGCGGGYGNDCIECCGPPSCSISCGASCEVDTNCAADGWYCNGDTRENRDYYCDQATCTCTYSVTSSENCNSYDGWYCNGNYMQEYDVYCSGGSCMCSRIPGQWENCDSYDGWYGGGNTAGCGDDPSSQYRDYYCSGASGSCDDGYPHSGGGGGANCNNYYPGSTFDCDSYDICSNVCDGTVIKSYKDYYVITNTNTCGYIWGSIVEDCSTKASTDTDSPTINYTVGGTVTDYTGCSGGACTFSTYSDSCSGTVLTEYVTNGSSFYSIIKECQDYEYYYCFGNQANFNRSEWGCSGSPGYCNDATVVDTQLDRDSSSYYCTYASNGCTAQIWMTYVPTSGTRCCGDDSINDNSYYNSSNPTTATSIICERCNAGSYVSPITLYGNGYNTTSKTTATSGICYYGDIICTASSAANGTSGTYYGNGYYTGSLTTSKITTCYYGDWSCSDGSAANGASAVIYGNGYNTSSTTTSTSLTCYYGDMTCSDGSYAHGASGTYYGNGYYTGSLSTSTSIICYYGDITCSDGYAANGTSGTYYGNGYLSGSGTSRTCYYGDISCSDGSAANGASAVIYGWGWYSGDLGSSTTVSCRSGPGTCTDGSASSDSISTLYGNGYNTTSKTTATSGICYYGNITCADGIEGHGNYSTVYGNGYNTSSTTTSTTVACYYGDWSCTDGSYAHGASGTYYGNGYYTGSLSTSTSIICYYGDITCSDGYAANGTSGTYYGNGYVSGNTCYYGDISCSDGNAANGSSCTLNINGGTGSQCIADVGCLNSPTSLTISVQSTTSIFISWTDNANIEDGFRIERSTNNSTWTEITNVSANTINYTDTGLSPNTLYYYRVRAYRGAINSGYSNVVNKYTFANAPSTAAFSNVNTTSIRANWGINGNPIGTEYYAERCTSQWSGCYGSNWVTNAFYDFTGLTANTIYYFRVKARNGDGIETDWVNLGGKYTLPTNPIISSSSHIVNVCSKDTNVNFTLSATANHYHYVWDKISTTIVSNSDTQWNGTFLSKIATSDGDWYIHVISHNPENASNPSGTIHSGPYKIDTIKPTTTINSPVNGSWQSSNFSVSISDSDTGCGINTSACYYRVLNNGIVTKGWTTRPCSSAITLTVGSGKDCASEGENNCTIEAYTKDIAGNIGIIVSRSFSIDYTLPFITLNSPTTANPIYKEAGDIVYVNYTYNEERPNNITIKIYNGSTTINQTIITDPSLGNVNRLDTLTIPSNTLDGTYNLSISMFDTAGNLITNVQMDSIIVDTTSPTVSSTIPSTTSPSYKRNGTVLYVNFTYTEINPRNYTITVYNLTTTICSRSSTSLLSGTNTISTNCTISFTAEDGNYTLKITIYDVLNHSINYTQTNAVIIDNTPPTIVTLTTIGTITINQRKYARGIITLNATAIDNPMGSGIQRVEFYYNNTLINISYSEPYSVQWDTRYVPDGVYNITAWAYDRAGNYKIGW